MPPISFVSLQQCRSYIAQLDQRFQNKEEEIAFKQSLRPQLLRSSAVCACIGIALYIHALVLRSTDPHIAISTMALPLRLACVIPVILSSGFLFLVGLEMKFGCVAVDWELLVVITASFFTIYIVSTVPARLGVLFAHDAHDLDVVYDPAWQSRIALILDSIVTGMCLYMRIRCCIIWIAPACGLFAHMLLMQLLESSTDEIGLNRFDMAVLLALTLVALHGAIGVEANARQNFRAQRQVGVQKGLLEYREEAMVRMLNRFCDCLVHIDSTFSILNSSERFAGMLLRGAGQSLQGAIFCNNFAAEQDCAVFREAVLRTGPDADYSEMLPIRLRDSCGNEFQTHAYYTRCKDESGGCTYLVGLVEAEERSRPGAHVGESESTHVPQVEHARPSQQRTPSQHSNSSRGCHAYAVPEFAETWVAVRVHSLIGMLRHWNIQIPPVQCCKFHAYVSEALSIMKSLKNVKSRKLKTYSDWQCPRCGATDESAEYAAYDEGACMWCEELKNIDTLIQPAGESDSRRAIDHDSEGYDSEEHVKLVTL